MNPNAPDPVSQFPRLMLPQADLRIRECDGQLSVFDPLRSRWVALTPEEWVRQHFTAWLTRGLGYPASLTANEVSLKLNRTLRRADTVVFDGHGNPWMIVEYKRPGVKISREVFEQALRYNIVLKARYIIVTNGMTHFCCECGDDIEGGFRFLRTVPPYSFRVR